MLYGIPAQLSSVHHPTPSVGSDGAKRAHLHYVAGHTTVSRLKTLVLVLASADLISEAFIINLSDSSINRAASDPMALGLASFTLICNDLSWHPIHSNF